MKSNLKKKLKMKKEEDKIDNILAEVGLVDDDEPLVLHVSDDEGSFVEMYEIRTDPFEFKVVFVPLVEVD